MGHPRPTAFWLISLILLIGVIAPWALLLPFKSCPECDNELAQIARKLRGCRPPGPFCDRCQDRKRVTLVNWGITLLELGAGSGRDRAIAALIRKAVRRSDEYKHRMDSLGCR